MLRKLLYTTNTVINPERAIVKAKELPMYRRDGSTCFIMMILLMVLLMHSISNQLQRYIIRNSSKKYFGRREPVGQLMRLDTRLQRAVVKDNPSNGFQFDMLLRLLLAVKCQSEKMMKLG